MIAIRRLLVPSDHTSPQAVFSHHPCHPLVIDHIAAMPDLSRHTAVAVARELVMTHFD